MMIPLIWPSLRIGAGNWIVVVVVAVAALSGCRPQSPGIMETGDLAELPSDEQLKQQIDDAIDFTYHKRHLNLRDHAAWQIIHGTVAFGRDFQVENDGQLVSAVDYVLAGGQMNGWEFQPGDMLGGRRGLRSVLQAGSKTGQGHPDQWLGYLSGCGLPPDQTIIVGGLTYTLEDLITQVEADVPNHTDSQEYSWTLMALSAYRPSDYEWTARDGKQWSIPRLVEIEAKQDLKGSACGGSHRLVGLTLALNRHLEQGGKIEGAWKLADDKIHEAVELARKYQNTNGSFSTHYFERPGTSPDLAESLGTTGHTLEFLVLALNDDEVKQDWVKRAVAYLCDVFHRTQSVSLECGALYHSAHGLVLYRERQYGPRAFAVK